MAQRKAGVRKRAPVVKMKVRLLTWSPTKPVDRVPLLDDAIAALAGLTSDRGETFRKELIRDLRAARARYYSKEAPTLDAAFGVLPRRRPAQAWHEKLIEYGGRVRPAGGPAWDLYLEGRRAGRYHEPLCREIASTLGFPYPGVARYLREALNQAIAAYPDANLPRPAPQGRPRKTETNRG